MLSCNLLTTKTSVLEKQRTSTPTSFVRVIPLKTKNKSRILSIGPDWEQDDTGEALIGEERVHQSIIVSHQVSYSSIIK